MTTQMQSSPKSKIINSKFIVGLIILLAVVLISGYVWLQTDQMIAPPAMRVMDGLWRLFFV